MKLGDIVWKDGEAIIRWKDAAWDALDFVARYDAVTDIEADFYDKKDMEEARYAERTGEVK